MNTPIRNCSVTCVFDASLGSMPGSVGCSSGTQVLQTLRAVLRPPQLPHHSSQRGQCREDLDGLGKCLKGRAHPLHQRWQDLGRRQVGEMAQSPRGSRRHVLGLRENCAGKTYGLSIWTNSSQCVPLRRQSSRIDGPAQGLLAGPHREDPAELVHEGLAVQPPVFAGWEKAFMDPRSLRVCGIMSFFGPIT